ncbi:MAG: hypothetical protein H0X49_11790 [Acidobacteria bacterium]|nr:hypothetical protein [Acidobacteriota bacterium]
MPDVKNKNLAVSEFTKLMWLVTGQLWRFGIGEDPDWGTRPIDQIQLQTVIHGLAESIADKEVKKQIQSAAAKGVEKQAQAMSR